jgi:transposase
VPKPFPKELGGGVVRVARGREPGVTLEQIAKNLGIHPMTSSKWIRQSDIDDGVRLGSADCREGRPACSE